MSNFGKDVLQHGITLHNAAHERLAELGLHVPAPMFIDDEMSSWTMDRIRNIEGLPGSQEGAPAHLKFAHAILRATVDRQSPDVFGMSFSTRYSTLSGDTAILGARHDWTPQHKLKNATHRDSTAPFEVHVTRGEDYWNSLRKPRNEQVSKSAKELIDKFMVVTPDHLVTVGERSQELHKKAFDVMLADMGVLARHHGHDPMDITEYAFKIGDNHLAVIRGTGDDETQILVDGDAVRKYGKHVEIDILQHDIIERRHSRVASLKSFSIPSSNLPNIHPNGNYYGFEAQEHLPGDTGSERPTRRLDDSGERILLSLFDLLCNKPESAFARPYSYVLGQQEGEISEDFDRRLAYWSASVPAIDFDISSLGLSNG